MTEAKGCCSMERDEVIPQTTLLTLHLPAPLFLPLGTSPLPPAAPPVPWSPLHQFSPHQAVTVIAPCPLPAWPCSSRVCLTSTQPPRALAQQMGDRCWGCRSSTGLSQQRDQPEQKPQSLSSPRERRESVAGEVPALREQRWCERSAEVSSVTKAFPPFPSHPQGGPTLQHGT